MDLIGCRCGTTLGDENGAMNMINVDLERVAAIMRRVATAEAMPHWRHLGAGDIVEKNGPDDLVTVADRAMEVALSRELEQLLPGSCVVGEEGVAAEPKVLEMFEKDAPIWVIDPIDGTSAFAKGDPEFAVMVALVQAQQPVAGWILAPVTGDLVCGQRGEGVWHAPREGVALERVPRPARVPSLAQMHGITGRRLMTPERQARIAAAASRFASIAPAICAGIEYPKIARGAAHFALYNKSEPWDHLPGLALAIEQGFHFARHDGTPYRPADNTGGLLVAPDRESWGQIHALLLDV